MLSKTENKNKNKEIRFFWYLNVILILTFYIIQTFHTKDLAGLTDGLSIALLSISLILAASSLGVRAAIISISIVLLVNIMITAGSHIYLKLYQTFVPASILGLYSESLSLLDSLPVMDVIASCGLAFICFFSVHLIVKKKCKIPPQTHLIAVSILFFTTSIILQVIHDKRPLKHFDSVSESPAGFFLRSANAIPFIDGNPLAQRMTAINTYATAINQGKSDSLPIEYLDAIKSFYPDRQISDSLYPLFIHHLGGNKTSLTHQPPSNEKKNVILFVLESIRASETDLNKNRKSATPFIDSLTSESIAATKFYATAPLTVKSETAIHCSILDFFGGQPASSRHTKLKTSCLPNILTDHGYRTFWFHGNNKDFYDRTEYLPMLGFTNTYGIEDLYGDKFDQPHFQNLKLKTESSPILGWGIPDRNLFSIALNKLEQVNEPFFAEILSVSNHIPFEYDWGISFPDHLKGTRTFYEKYRRGIYYTDQALKLFFDKFKQSKLHDNTIVIVTGDHGVWAFDDESALTDLNKHEQFFRVPLLIYQKGSSNQKIPQPSSHLDIAPTILSLLKIKSNNSFLGRSLIENAAQPAPIFNLYEAEYGFRFGDHICVPERRCFRNGPSCKDWENKLYKKSNISCFKDTGDTMFDLESERSDIPIDTLTNFDNLLNYSMLGLDIGFTPSSNNSILE